MHFCPKCRTYGRSSRLGENDARCGRCGHLVRDIEVVLPGSTKSVNGLLWLHSKDAPAALSLEVRNCGAFEVRVGAVVAVVPGGKQSPAGVVVEMPPKLLAPGESSPVRVVLQGPPAQAPHELQLQFTGGFPEKRVRICIDAAPTELIAEAEDDDVLSPIVAREQGLSLKPGGRVTATAQALRWEIDEVALATWSQGRVLLRIRQASTSEAMQLPAILPESLTWEGQAGVAVSAQASLRNGIVIGIEAPGIREPVRGLVRFAFNAASCPQVAVKVLLVPRPEFRLSEASAGEPELVPCDFPSLRHIELEAVNGRNALLQKVTDFALAVKSDDARVEWQRIGAVAGGGHHFRLIIDPPRKPGLFDVQLCLTGRIASQEIQLSLPAPLSFEAALSSSDRFGKRVRVVVDFGTINTCVCQIDLEPTCLKLDQLTSGERRRDIIPTRMWLLGTRERDKPRCIIGAKADMQDGGLGMTVPPFKPDIGICNKAPPPVPREDGGEAWRYSYSDFAFFYLRQLLLEARAALGQTPFDAFLVTYPSTFNVEQRNAMEEVLRRLRPYGITHTASVQLDEANAGAYWDLKSYLTVSQPPAGARYAIIFDFGGGTIDIAILSASPYEPVPGRSGYRIRPLGLTGLRDFGGRNVTQAIATALGRKLYAALYAGENTPPMTIETAPWIPLPKKVLPPGLELVSSMGRQVAERNGRFLEELGEQVKILAYGCADSPRAEENLIQMALGEMGDTLRSRLYLINEGATVVADPAWRDKLLCCSLTRHEMDDIIRPALVEAFSRSRRLWDAVREQETLTGPYKPPDLLLLAGMSSLLPIVRQVAASKGEECLGVPDSQILYDRDEAKTKVAKGAAWSELAQAYEPIVPEPALNYLLIPLVKGVGMKSGVLFFERLFKLGYEIPAQGVPGEVIERDTRHYSQQLLLDLYQNMDFRDQTWTPDKKLRDLGVDSPGKEPAVSFDIEFANLSDTCIKYWLELRESARWLCVTWNTGKGEKKL